MIQHLFWILLLYYIPTAEHCDSSADTHPVHYSLASVMTNRKTFAEFSNFQNHSDSTHLMKHRYPYSSNAQTLKEFYSLGKSLWGKGYGSDMIPMISGFPAD